MSLPFFSTLLPVLSPAAGRAPVTTLVRGRIRFRLAPVRGFCHGVERALARAREALEARHGRRVFITSPILHNPQINAELRRAGVEFLSDSPELWSALCAQDIVLLPAFGVAPQVEARVRSTGAQVVDTTCGSVVFVWKMIERLARDGLTLVYHGMRGHEEAVAALARFQAACARAGREARFAVVESRRDVETLEQAIRSPDNATRQAAARSLLSENLDDPRALDRVGFASQTTMLESETREIERRLQSAMAARHGAAALSLCFHPAETICGATQERQDALAALLIESLDAVIVVGGFASSNSRHLVELASQRCAAYHVEGPQDVVSSLAIRHLRPGSSAPGLQTGWLGGGEVKIGVTSGASTPEAALQAVIDRVAEVAAATG